MGYEKSVLLSCSITSNFPHAMPTSDITNQSRYSSAVLMGAAIINQSWYSKWDFSMQLCKKPSSANQTYSKKKTLWVRTNLLQSKQNSASHPCYILLSIFPGCLVWGDCCKNCHQPSRSSHLACCIWHSRCLMCGNPSHTGHYIHSCWPRATYA